MAASAIVTPGWKPTQVVFADQLADKQYGIIKDQAPYTGQAIQRDHTGDANRAVNVCDVRVVFGPFSADYHGPLVYPVVGPAQIVLTVPHVPGAGSQAFEAGASFSAPSPEPLSAGPALDVLTRLLANLPMDQILPLLPALLRPLLAKSPFLREFLKSLAE